MQSLHVEVTEMKIAENENDQFEELEEGGAAVAQAPHHPKFNSARHAPY